MHGRPENATAAIDPNSRREHRAGTEVGRRSALLLGARGLLAVVFGVVVLAWPGITLLALAVVFAFYVLADAIGMLVSGVESRGSRRWSYVLAGVVGLIAGLAAAFWPGIGALALATVLGIYALAAGASYFWAAWQLHRGPVVALAP